MPELGVGSEIAGCRLESIAGRGGMGVVWRATQIALNRPVALKAIAPQLAQDQAFRDRFQRESLLAASIDHPNVIPVYEAGELDGTLFLIMRWVDGTDLRARIMAEGRMAPAKAIRLLRPVASALAAAHRRGLIHRDVKPANVLITTGDDEADEHVYLTDFGIARRNDSRGMTRTGVLVGTLDYIAPEMIQGGRGNQLSDIYGFGCMLFETLTGHVPFDRPTELAKMHAHITDPVPIDDLPPALVPIVSRAMAKNPEDRFGSASELVAALDALRETGTGARTGPVEPDPATVLSSAVAEEDGATVLAPSTPPPPPETPAPPPETPAPPPETPAPPPTDDQPTTLDRPATPPPATPVSPATPPPPAAPPTPATPPPPAAPATPVMRTSAAAPPPERRRLLLPLVLLGVVVLIVAVLVATSGGGGNGGGTPTVSARVVSGSGVAAGAPKAIGDTPVALAPDTGDAWAATRGQLIQLAAGGGTQIVDQQSYSGPATALAVDARSRLWLTGIGRPDGVHPAKGNVIEAGQGTNLLALDSQAAWIGTRGASTIVRADLGSLSSAPHPVTGPLATFGVGFARVWAAASDGRVTVLDADGNRNAVPAPNVAPGTVGVVPSNGVWFVSSDGTLNRMDPRTALPEVKSSGHYVLHPVSQHIDGGATAVGAWPDTNAIWILSRASRSLVRVATQGAEDGKITARVTFGADPGHLAVGDHVVWVDIPSAHEVIPITYR
jgi:serine/threonine protein kinase